MVVSENIECVCVIGPGGTTVCVSRHGLICINSLLTVAKRCASAKIDPAVNGLCVFARMRCDDFAAAAYCSPD